MKISKIHARQILDSRGIPTVEVDVTLDNGNTATASVPSGTSTGTHEAVELRDGDKSLFNGKSVLKAIENVNVTINKALSGEDAANQEKIDEMMIALDGTENKSNLGSNSILGVSIAICKAIAKSRNMPVYQYIGELSQNHSFGIPYPMVLMLEGGKHGNFATDIQEFMVIPQTDRFNRFQETLEATVKIFYCLEELLKKRNYSTGVGFEGAFCPKELSSNEEALQLLIEAIKAAEFQPEQDFSIAVDIASSEFFKNGKYILESEERKSYDPKEWTDKLIQWTKNYPITSVEDPHQEDLWESWTEITTQLGQTHQIVGDDLVVTNLQRIKKAIDKKAINAVLIKLNQTGTVTETLRAIALTKQAGWMSIVSHRSGETNDDFIADLAVGAGVSQCKFGGVQRGERISKYNRLLRIEEETLSRLG